MMMPDAGQSRWVFETKENQSIHRKSVKVKINHQAWHDVNSFVVFPMSIHSAIYDGVNGDLKIKGFLNTIKSYSKSKILILFCEGAHLNALSIKHDSIQSALTVCDRAAQELLKRFEEDFIDCELSYWEDFIWTDHQYNKYKSELSNLYEKDEFFRVLINNESYKYKPFDGFSSDLFYKKTQLDILEMMAGIMIMHDKNYKILIYPGAFPSPFKYIKSNLNRDLIYINASIKVKLEN